MKILIVSDSPNILTGLGRVSREISTRLKKNHVVQIAGWFDTVESTNQEFVVHRLPRRELGFEYLEPICRKEKFDVGLAIGDPWYFGYLSQLKWFWKARDFSMPWVGYLTIDGDPLPNSFKNIFQSFDMIASCTQYGKDQIQKVCEVPVEVIPYGVDTNVFKPLCRDEIRRQLGLQNSFVILCDSQNTPRKNIWALLQAFELFQTGKPTLLYLFTNVDDPSRPMLRESLWKLSKECRTKIIASSQYSILQDKSLNALYNLSDVLALPSMNEGFGLPLLQALANGVLPIGTDYASIPEVMGSFGVRVKPSAYFVSEWGMRCAVLNPQDFSDQLNRVFTSWWSRGGFSPYWKAEAKKYAESFSWNTVGDKIEFLLKQTRERFDEISIGCR